MGEEKEVKSTLNIILPSLKGKASGAIDMTQLASGAGRTSLVTHVQV